MDVFCLGVLISELLSEKEAASRSIEGGGDEKNVAEVLLLSEMLAAFMDGRLRGQYPVELANSMAETASKCVAVDLNDRPSVSEVFATLSKILSSSLDWDPSDELEHSSSLSHGR
ncbi:putative non-specific serine/threonine protein kinase [Helianthus anomalus]